MSLEHVVLKSRFPDKQLTVVLEDFKKAINHLVDVENDRSPAITTAHDVLVQHYDCYWKPSDNAADIYRPTGYVTIGGESQKTDKLRVIGGLGIYDSAAAPYLRLTNASDTARDPVMQFAVGATPVTGFTLGVDHSWSIPGTGYDLTLCSGSSLIETYASDGTASLLVDIWSGAQPEIDVYPIFEAGIGADSYCHLYGTDSSGTMRADIETGWKSTNTAKSGYLNLLTITNDITLNNPEWNDQIDIWAKNGWVTISAGAGGTTQDSAFIVVEAGDKRAGQANRAFLTFDAGHDIVLDFNKDLEGLMELAATKVQPIFRITNQSDTARDPVLQFALGATPVVKYTMGVDDSDGDKWKLGTGSLFGDDHDVLVLESGDAITPPVAEFTLIDTWQTPITGTAETAGGAGTDGTHLYYSVNATGGLVKVDPVTGTETLRVTIASSSFAQLAVDSEHVYVIEQYGGQRYIEKYKCSDLSYVSSTDLIGETITSIFYWGGHLYLTDQSNGIRKVRCSDMSLIWRVSYPVGDPHFCWPDGIAVDGSFIYVLDDLSNGIIRLNMDGSFVDLTAVVNPMQNDTLWLSGQYLYVGVNTSRVDQLLKSDLSLVATFTVAASDIHQAFYYNAHHYLASHDDTCIYKYTATSTEVAGEASLQIRLRDIYGQMADVARFTGDVRFGVGTTIPTETIEGVGNIKATGGQFISTKATGTAPVVVSSTTVCTNLNAGLVDGYHHDQSLLTTAAPSFDHLHLTIADGTAPLVVTSTTEVANFNAHLLQGHHAADFAHADAKYIVQELSGDLSAEQSLGALATGILKNTTTAGVGVLSIASGSDLPDHSILSATHGDSTAASVVLGDIISGQGASPNSKWARYAGNTTAVKQYLSQTGTGAVSAAPAWATPNAVDIVIPGGLGTPTYDDTQDFLNTTRSAGRLTGGAVTKGTGATVSITDLDGMIFTGNTLGTSPLIYFKKAAQTSITPTGLTDGAVNWIYIDYDGGSLTYKATTTRSTIDEYTMFTVARVWVSGTTLEVQQHGHNLYNKDRRSHDRLILKYGDMDRVSGGVLSALGVLGGIQSDAGSWYVANILYTTGAQTTFFVWYKHEAGAWTRTAALSLFSEEITGGHAIYETYQNGTDLTALSGSNYGVYWVYLCPEGNLYIALGTSSYANVGLAQAATVPAPPPYMTNWGGLIGRVITKKGTVPLYSVESVFSTQFTLSAAVDHASLANLTAADSHPQAAITGLTTADGPTFDHLHLTTDLPVSEGGTGASTFTDHGVLYGQAANAIGATAEGATGSYLAGTTGAAPSFATLNQAAVAGLTTADGPQFNHVHIEKNGAILSTTSVGSDDGALSAIAAGAVDSSRGASFSLYGVNDATHPGDIYFMAANTAGAIRFFTGTQEHFTVGLAGDISVAHYINAPLTVYKSTEASLIVQGADNPWTAGLSLWTGGGEAATIKAIGATGEVRIGATAANNYVTLYANGSEAVRILTSGNVGINDTAPAEKLDVNGNINVTGVYKVDDVQIGQADILGLTTADGPTWDHVHLLGTSGTQLEVLTNGSVVSLFNSIVQVTAYAGTVPSTAGEVQLRKVRGTVASPSPTLTGDRLGLLAFASGYNATPSFRNLAAILAYAEEDHDATHGGTFLIISTTSLGGTSRSERLRITAGGNVGINDNSPAEKLDVTGNINVTGVYKVADVQIAQKDIVGLTTADGPTWDHVHITNNADVGGAYQVDSVQVVGNRQTAIAEPAETTAANTAAIKYMLDTLAAHGLLTAQEKVVNGGFDSTTTGWTASDSTLASIAGGQSGNCLEITQASGAQGDAYATVTGLVVGISYTVSFYVKSGSSGNEAYDVALARTSDWGDQHHVAGTSSGSWVQGSHVLTATSDSYYFYLSKQTATAGTMLFDTCTWKVTQ